MINYLILLSCVAGIFCGGCGAPGPGEKPVRGEKNVLSLKHQRLWFI